MSDECRADISRIWDSTPADDAALSEAAYEILDRATALRRVSAGKPEWPVARLAEGLARLLVARQMAGWGHRSYAIQALEASMDALRDAALELPDEFIPSREEVFAFRDTIHREWRAAQSEADLQRIAGLKISALRDADS
jgi:hypothetical protein